MKFIVEFKLKPGSKEKVLEKFELIGPNRNPGVTFRGAWIGARDDVIFVLSESIDEALITKICQSWSSFGESRIIPVIDIEQY